MKYHIGKLIDGICQERSLDREKIYGGLCDKRTFQKIEQGMLDPGKWLADTLMERMGVSPNKFGYLLTKEEEEEYEQSLFLVLFLQQEKREELKRLLKNVEGEVFEKKEKSYRKNCKKQFQAYIFLASQACFPGFYLWQEEEQDQGEQQGAAEYRGIEGIVKALRITLPDFGKKRLREFWFGKTEWALVVLLADRLYQKKRRKKRGYFLYQQILWQMPKQQTDKELLRICYPYVIALFLFRLEKNRDSSESWLVRKGLDFLGEEGKLYGIEAMLRYGIFCMEQNRKKDRMEERTEEDQELGWQRQALDTVESARRNYGKQEYGAAFYYAKLAEVSIRGQKQGEAIRHVRHSLGKTQAEVSKDIDHKMLSKFETGKKEPSLFTLQRVGEALGWKERRYFPFICSDDFRLHEYRRQVAALIVDRKWEEADFELLQLEMELDRKEALNQQTLLRLRTVIDAGRGRISGEEKLRRLEQALALTVPPEAKLAEWPLDQGELVLLNNIANTKEAMGDLAGATALLEAGKHSCESRQNGIAWNQDAYLLILYNLSRYIGQMGQYQEALELIETGLQVSYQAGNGIYLGRFLYKKAWNLEEQCKEKGDWNENKKEACLKLHRQAFSLAYVLKQKKRMEIIKKHCQETYGIDIRREYKAD
ncbi:MAG: hypothetical protein HFI40_12945 [Lachnospiraceae bacterium]|jgi:transcriptional regulator with XRE-family HTH domain|nr:hypothetical protein [Lachnospiraceae bacterium]